MRMLSAPVLLGAAIASSPALYQGFVTQTVPLEQAGGRFAVALVLAWVAISAVAMMVGEPPKPVVEPADETDADATAPSGTVPAPGEAHAA